MADDQNILISVIVPVYGVEKFIGKCAESLFCQTMNEGVEFIFVDDATQDSSIDILKETLTRYPQRAQEVKILKHPVNKGLPAARNTGLAAAKGRYIFHCDSDDFLQRDFLRKMVDKALEEDADIVWCDWFLTFHQNERPMREPDPKIPQEALRMMLCGAMKYNVWNKIVRSSLYRDNEILFPEGYSMGEDMTLMMLFAKASKIAHLKECLYHYNRTNDKAMTMEQFGKNLDSIRYNIERVSKFFQEQRIGDYKDYFKMLRLNAKLPLLVSDRKCDYQQWAAIDPDTNKYAMCNPYLPIYLRILQWMAWKRQWWYVRLYHNLVYKVVYGKIYK